MSWQTVATAMLPEHLLLAGICVLVALESAPGRSRGAFAVSIVAVTAAASHASRRPDGRSIAANSASRYSGIHCTCAMCG